MLEKFAARLKEVREEMDLSQNALSNALGISRVSLTHYEAGDRTPDIEVLAKLHEVTGVSVYYFLGLSDSKDDRWKDTQPDTGLSERSLNALSSSKVVQMVFDSLLTNADEIAKHAAILHDNTLIEKEHSDELAELNPALQLIYSSVCRSEKNKLISSIQKALDQTAEPFGANPKELPFNSTAILRGIGGAIKQGIIDVQKFDHFWKQAVNDLHASSEETDLLMNVFVDDEGTQKED
ncbi:MAG: helix-turn-helix transcriptional regulator [Clostridia bacterium]|nr:helix-turn-helix transcriptional regulator [Clostridia bacterium]